MPDDQVNVLAGRILTRDGWVTGRIHFGKAILEIEADSLDFETLPSIVPGFIDVHVHGGGGFDTMDGADGVRGLARFHARHGTTALLATTITNPWDRVLGTLAAVREVINEPITDGARILGAHLEGPFISPNRLGAQPPHAVEPTPERVQAVLQSGVIRVVTIAPELNGAQAAIEQFVQSGVRVSLGHTVADAEQATHALELVIEAGGTASGTHLFNAMGGLEGRKPGVVGAILASKNAFAELILDGFHVHQASFLTAYHAKPDCLMLITDAIRAAGLPDGVTELGGQSVTVSGGMARLADGTLAGSVLTMDQAVRNAVRAGLRLEDAVRLASSHPADYLGLQRKGRLEVGLDADLVVLNDTLEVQDVFVEGRHISC
jgi:N-acetylglucosamine-6-phosphate deacetylase